MIQQQEQGFIGSRLKLIPNSHLIYSTPTQLLLNTKRQVIRLDTNSQTLVYSNIEDQKVIHVAYHPNLEVYCLLTEKYVLFVNSQGELIKKITNETLNGSQFFFIVCMSDGYKGEPNNRDDFMIYVKSDYLYSATAKVYYERQMIKSKGICDMGLQVEQTEMFESPQFIQHAKYMPEVALLILWNSKETWIYRTPRNWEEKFERLYIYNKISKRENLSLQYAVSMPSKTLAVGFESGVIKIFLLDESRKYLLDLKGHQTACTTLLVPDNNPYLLYSASPDSTVRIWNLHDYEQVYMLQLDLLVRSIQFVSDTLLFLTTDELKSKSYLCQINTSLLDPIVNDNRSGQLLKMRCDEDWCISIYSNHLIEFMSILNHHQTPQNQKVEFPLQYGTIIDVFRIDEDLYAVSLEKGFSLVKFDKKQIKGQNFDLKKLVYNESIIRKKQQNDFIELIHEKLLDTYIFNALSDWKQIPTAISLSTIYFHKNKWLPMWNLTAYQRTKPQKQDVNYCVLGSSKGQIYFVDISKRVQFTTKVHFHSEPVNLIREITHQSNKYNTFISVSLDRQISIWNLSHKESPSTLVSFNYNRNITYLQVHENFILVGQKSGEFNILQVQVSQNKIQVLKSNNTTGHLRAVICGDYLFYKQSHLFLSGGQDSAIKIWKGVQKQLIFQLKLFGIINTVNFIHQKLNLIVCHNEQISFIKQEKLKSLGKADKILNNNNQQQKHSVENINIRDFFMQEASSPLSPVKKGYMRLSRYGSLVRKIRVEDSSPFMLTKNEIEQDIRGSSIKKNMKSTPLFEDTGKKQKIKRFHAFSIQEYNKQLQLQLPRIKTRNPSSITSSRNKKDHELIQELKDIRNKSLSMAGRKPL